MRAIGHHRFLEVLPGAGQARGTLLLIHAFPLTARMWEPQLGLSAEGWHVVAPHLRGLGDGASQAPSGSMDEYAADLVDLLDALGVEQAVIAGLSLGGYIALALYRRAAGRFRGLVLSDTRSEADTPEARQGRMKMLALVREQGPAAVAEQMIPRLLAPETVTTQPDLVERVRGMIVSNGVAGIAAAISAMMTRPDSTPVLEDIDCPTRVLVGEHDALTPPALAETLQRGIRRAELTVIDGAGHLPNLEQPAAFNAALAAFLGSI